MARNCPDGTSRSNPSSATTPPSNSRRIPRSRIELPVVESSWAGRFIAVHGMINRYNRASMTRCLMALAVLLTLTSILPAQTAAPAKHDTSRYFVIQVIDDQAGRGVPLVQLRTVANQQFWTDSNGLVALDDPALMGQKVFFFVESDGYEFPADGFKYRGRTLDVTPGGSATLQIKRLNIAERLYRVTGQDIYRDTVLAGRAAPIKHPLLDARVVGQDSVQTIIYRGKIYWFWGDTAWPQYPLGQFATSGAISELPGHGGLDPFVGVDLDYFAGPNGFSRPMVDVAGPGPKWIDGLMIVKDDSGRERLIANFARMQGLGRTLERGLLIFDDDAAIFRPMVHVPLDAPLYPVGHPFHVSEGGKDYFYFPVPFPVIRVAADFRSVKDLASYEAYTCLVAGTRYRRGGSKLDRASDGSLNWGWKRHTSPVGPGQERQLIAAGVMKDSESRFILHDAQSDRAVIAHGGSVCYNAFRKKWIMIFVEAGGRSSYLGEVWYAQADAPLGPWHWARKIVTHNHYSFYNPAQHPFFDQQGGKIIYFEGTYANTFSGDDHPTPLYDYNQIMYRLDLSDPRLAMPELP